MTKINDSQESNFPSGFSGGVSIRNVSILNTYSGKVFWVNSNGGSDQNIGTRQRPKATIKGALAMCRADYGDVIMIKSNHSEAIIAAGTLNCNVSGVAIIGLGQGADRPTLNFTTATTASVTVTAANTTIQNIIGVAGINALVNPFNVTAADCYLDLEWQDPTTILEAVSVVLTSAAAKRLNLKLKYKGQTGGSSCVNPIKLVGTPTARIWVDFVGKASTAVVNFVTTLSTDIVVNGYIYNASVTDGSKDIVDTIGSSTWFGRIDDGSAGATYEGGSAIAWAKADVSGIVASLLVPAADATTNAQERDVIGNKTDAAVTAVGTTKSIVAYLKGLVTMETVQVQDSTNNAFNGDITGNKTDTQVTAVGTTKSIMAYAKGLITMLTVQAQDSTNNAFEGDVVGNKTDTAVYALGTTKSLAAYNKGILDMEEKTVKSTQVGAPSNGMTLFTVAGGPIMVTGLCSIFLTANNAVATTFQYEAISTLGSLTGTISAACTTLSAVAAGVSVALVGTTLATAASVNLNGVALMTLTPILVEAGTINLVVATAGTGTVAHYLRYKPMAPGVTVTG